MLTVRTTSAASGFSATYVPVSTNVPFPGTSGTLEEMNAVKSDWVKDGLPPSFAAKSEMLIVAAGASIGPTKASATIPVSNNSLLFIVVFSRI
jgi:hypothetical protein